MIGALLGTQNGREVEIVNTFELAMLEDGQTVNQEFLVSRREQCTYSRCAIIQVLIRLNRQTSIPVVRIYRLVHCGHIPYRAAHSIA